MRVDFKFNESASTEVREGVVGKLKQRGVKVVQPQFPGESDAQLASMYKAEGVPDADAEALCKELAGEDAVEFAEPTPDRGLIE